MGRLVRDVDNLHHHALSIRLATDPLQLIALATVGMVAEWITTNSDREAVGKVGGDWRWRVVGALVGSVREEWRTRGIGGLGG